MPEAVIEKRGGGGLRLSVEDGLQAGLRLSREPGKGAGAVAEAKCWWHGTYTTVMAELLQTITTTPFGFNRACLLLA